MIYVAIALLIALAFTIHAASRRIRTQDIQMGHVEAKQKEATEAYQNEVATRNSVDVELMRSKERADALKRLSDELAQERDSLSEDVAELKARLGKEVRDHCLCTSKLKSAEDRVHLLEGKVESCEGLHEQCECLSQQVDVLNNIRLRSEVENGELMELVDQYKKANEGAVPVADWIVGTTALSRYIKQNAKQTRQLLQSDTSFPAYFANVGANKIWDRKLVDHWLEKAGA